MLVKKGFTLMSSGIFENIPSAVWKYQIGGYRVMEKYLKDRKGREMDDPGHYCKMAAAIAKQWMCKKR